MILDDLTLESFCEWCASAPSFLHIVINMRKGRPEGVTAFVHNREAKADPCLAMAPLAPYVDVNLLSEWLQAMIHAAMEPGRPDLDYRLDIDYATGEISATCGTLCAAKVEAPANLHTAQTDNRPA